MASRVVALSKGYAGGMIREQGDKFVWPEGVPVGSWVKPAAFAGKGDLDGNGLTGGSLPADAGKHDARKAVDVPADWQNLHAPEMKALAEQISGEKAPNKAEAEKVIAAYLEASTAEPFGDAPAPATIKGNGVQEATGGPAPDWLPPGADGADAKPSADTPVADEDD